MRSIVISRAGGPEVLEITERDVPHPKSGEVTIDVSYAGLTFVDTLFRRIVRDGGVTPGLEVSGRIREVGAGVTGVSVGQPVTALTVVNLGGYAEVVAVDARLVGVLPSDDEQLLVAAAGLPTNGTTALLALERAGRIATGEVVLVHAAASGLGTQLGQFARSMGAGAVVGTVGSAAKIEVAKRFGYDTVVLRDEWVDGAVETPPANLIVDMVGGAARGLSAERLPPDGRLVVVGNASGEPEPSIDTGMLFRSSRTVAGFSIGALAPAQPELVGQALQRAVDMLHEGRLDVGIDRVYPFDASPAAHRAIDAGTTTGKSVLAVRPSKAS